MKLWELILWFDNFLENLFHRPNYDKPVIKLPMNQTTPSMPISKPVETSPKPTLQQLCDAITRYEGGPGDRNYRNNNPGNCRYSSVGYLAKYEPVKMDAKRFAVFPSWEVGMDYLRNLLKGKAIKYPSWTLLDLMTHYAPVEDDNDPTTYAKYLAKQLGVDITYKINNFL